MELTKYNGQVMKARLAFSKIVLWTICVALSFGVTCRASEARSGQKPQWVSKGESSLNNKRSNNTYYFKVVHNIGSDLQELRRGNANALADYIGKQNQIKGISVTELTNRTDGGGAHSDGTFNMMFTNEFSSDVFYATLIDEYWENEAPHAGVPEYHYYALFAVSAAGARRPSFDQFEVTRSYGAGPTLMSVIPGVGQLYKGQRLKGSLMLGGAALGAGVIILCESRRSYYQTRMVEQPKFAREYHSKSDHWMAGRNIAIGATAALMVWSVIDAAVAPGATRVKVSPSSALSFRPAVITSQNDLAMGAAFAITF